MKLQRSKVVTYFIGYPVRKVKIECCFLAANFLANFLNLDEVWRHRLYQNPGVAGSARIRWKRSRVVVVDFPLFLACIYSFQLASVVNGYKTKNSASPRLCVSNLVTVHGMGN